MSSYDDGFKEGVAFLAFVLVASLGVFVAGMVTGAWLVGILS